MKIFINVKKAQCFCFFFVSFDHMQCGIIIAYVNSI